MYCSIRHVYCEQAGELTVQLDPEFDRASGEKKYTVCFNAINNKPCPWGKVDQLIREDIERTHRVIAELNKNEMDKNENSQEIKRGSFVLYNGGIYRVHGVLWLTTGEPEPEPFVKLSGDIFVPMSRCEPITETNIYEILPF